jgi:hypothetical protein
MGREARDGPASPLLLRFLPSGHLGLDVVLVCGHPSGLGEEELGGSLRDGVEGVLVA